MYSSFLGLKDRASIYWRSFTNGASFLEEENSMNWVVYHSWVFAAKDEGEMAKRAKDAAMKSNYFKETVLRNPAIAKKYFDTLQRN